MAPEILKEIRGLLFLRYLFLLLFCCGDNQTIAFSMDVVDLDGRIVFQMLAQFCDIYIHAPGIEIVVINPNRLQSQFTL